MASALARGLEAEGFVVDTAADGPAGLEAARFGGYDAVLLDVMLPRMSGYTVVRTLREEQNWVPVLMLSAKDGEYDEADGRTTAPTTTSRSPSRSSCCWRGCGPSCAASRRHGRPRCRSAR